MGWRCPPLHRLPPVPSLTSTPVQIPSALLDAGLTRLGVAHATAAFVGATFEPSGRLVALDLTARGITTLPASLAQCTALQALLLGRNALTDLPEGLGGLRRLERLHLNHNRLRGLPGVLARLAGDEARGVLPALRVLRLEENPLIDCKGMKASVALGDGGSGEHDACSWEQVLAQRGCVVVR
jgi:Leucine-rich repeat (LRR) protein